MAQVKYGPLVTKIRGSLATVTFSAARSGEIVRDRTYPRDPRSTFQATYRRFFSESSSQWITALSEQRRIDWNTLAAGTTYTNSAGDPYHPSGINLFTGSNALLDLATQANALDPPTSARFDAPQLENTFIAVDGLGFTDPTGWAPQYRPHIIVRRSAAVSEGVFAFTGPFVDYEVHHWIELDPGPMTVFDHELEVYTPYFIQFVGVRTDPAQPGAYGSISYKQIGKYRTLHFP